MKQWIFSDDPYQMNWFREDSEYASIVYAEPFPIRPMPLPLDVDICHEVDGDILKTKITFTNKGNKPLFLSGDSIGIRIPLCDSYDSSDICISKRCHVHLFCSGGVCYIMALRMGGDAPHFGLLVTQGSISHYSIERDIAKRSNDRGVFLLHPDPIALDIGDSFTVSWTIFPHQGKEDFYRQLPNYGCYLSVSADRYVLYKNEAVTLRIQPSFPVRTVDVNREPTPVGEDGVAVHMRRYSEIGEQTLDIRAGDVQTTLRLLVMPELSELVRARCDFIVRRQQYSGTIEHLDGAYLSYDNEEQHIVYDGKRADLNAGRERVGMGLLLAKQLQITNEEMLYHSLKRYITFVLRELVDEQTGETFNDAFRDNSHIRLYNAPWFAYLFVEMYRLEGDHIHLTRAVRILKTYYAQGGGKFYANELPMLATYEALTDANMIREREELVDLFQQHANFILACDLHYPPHEVTYEQSIVAPAADLLLQMYQISGENQYLRGAERQLSVLELFNGLQPDYHLYEMAIRHWDGFWFGKRQMFGDTFPHYWSALTGNVYARYALCTGREEYMRKAEASMRGVLSMFRPDGSATCAYLYPYRINGQRGEFADPYANDQDWGLYFLLRYLQDTLPRFQQGKSMALNRSM